MKKFFYLIIFLFVLLLLSSCDIVSKNSIDSKNVTQEETRIKVSIDEHLIESKSIDSVVISSVLINDSGYPAVLNKMEYGKSEIYGSNSLNYDLKNYGKHEVTISYRKEGKVIDKQFSEYVLTADEYNIALLRATLPVTYFSMLMTKGDSSINLDNSLPTIIAIERANSYDWDNLYDNMYPNPFSDIDKIKNNTSTSPNYFYSDFVGEMQEYVKYLYSLNPQSKFNLYLNDFSVEFMFKLIYENGIPNDSFSATFFSDGQGTYSYFRRIFGETENPSWPSLATLSRYEEALADATEKARKGDTSYISKITSLSGDRDLSFFGLLPILVNDQNLNIQWVVNRKSTDTFGASDVFNQKIKTNINVATFNLSNHSSSFTSEQTAKLKALFSFNITAFEDAEKQGKKILIFLGSRFYNETYLEDELILMKALCKDGYAYFYKGHPGDTYNEERTKILERQGIVNLDASIPAELFLLFKPEVEMCGIQSTTFDSYTHDEIPFIQGYSENLAYKDKVNTYVEATGDTSNPYKITRRKTGEYTYWNPNKPNDFNWV